VLLNVTSLLASTVMPSVPSVVTVKEPLSLTENDVNVDPDLSVKVA
jgi:hypothetical protein